VRAPGHLFYNKTFGINDTSFMGRMLFLSVTQQG